MQDLSVRNSQFVGVCIDVAVTTYVVWCAIELLWWFAKGQLDQLLVESPMSRHVSGSAVAQNTCHVPPLAALSRLYVLSRGPTWSYLSRVPRALLGA